MRPISEMTLTEITAEMAEITPKLRKAFDEAGADLDLSKVTAIAGDDAHAKGVALAEMNTRLDNLGQRSLAMESAAKGAASAAKWQEYLDGPAGAPPPGALPIDAPSQGYKSLSDHLTPKFEEMAKANLRKGEFTLDIDAKAYLDNEVKTVVSTGAGFAPQAIRSGLVVAAAQQMPTVIDLIPTVPTDQSAYVFMAQTTRTNSAAEAAESVEGTLVSLAESAFVWTQVSELVQRIGHYVPITDQQLKYIDGLRALIDGDMRVGVRQRLSSQVLNGTGTSPQIEGFLDAGRTDVNTHDATGQVYATGIAGAIEDCQVTGFAEPTAVVTNPSDWWAWRVLTTADGIYINGHPSEVGPRTIWGLPVVTTTEIASGTALTGDFAGYSKLVVGSGVEVAISSEHASYFIQGMNAIRAEVYATLAVTREAAFGKATNL